MKETNFDAVRINIDGNLFLLPTSHDDNYVFPTYIIENKSDILKCVWAYKEWLKNPLGAMPESPDMQEFKETTGIIGVPFDLRDVELFILDRNINIVMDIDI